MRRRLTGILAFGGIGIAVAASVSLGIGAFATESGPGADAVATHEASATVENQTDASAAAAPSAAATQAPTVAAKPGDPLATPPAAPSTDSSAAPADQAGAGPVVLTERQQWLVFQDAVRQCMAGEGQEYLYFEWWNPAYQKEIGVNPAMPPGLSTDEKASWELTLNGNTGGGADYHWENAGCWGITVQQFGNTH